MKNRIEFCVVAVVLLVLSVVVCGCVSEQAEQRPVWGKGDLDPNWVTLFGDENNARLDFVNTERINRLGLAFDDMAKRVQALELENPAELAERVRSLEEIASVVHPDEYWSLRELKGHRADPNISTEVKNAVEKGEIPKDNQ